MIVRISVNISAGPEDYQMGSTGNMNFSEEAALNGSHFETVSKVFTKIHDLIAVLKAEHGAAATGKKS